MDFLTKHKTQWCDEAHRSVDICAACEEELKAFIVLLYLSGIYGSTNTAIDSEESVKSEQSWVFFPYANQAKEAHQRNTASICVE